MRRSLFFIFFGIALCFCAMTSAAQAQATRTWVSGTGDDANPCSRTAPCKTFPGAYSRTAVGGEIDVLDPGGFGTISIGHALTIDGGGGIVSSILASSTSGVNVNAGATDKVELRHIRINGISQSSFPGTTGIIFNSGGLLIVDHVVVENFGTNGITFQPTNASGLFVIDSWFENFGNDGIIVSTASAAGGVNKVVIRNTHVTGAAHNGFEVGINSRVELYSDTSSNNGLDGLLANGSNINASVDDGEFSDNGFNGIHSQGGSNIRVSNTSIYDNANLGVSTDTGSIFSGLNNRVKGNQGGDGTFTGPIPLS